MLENQEPQENQATPELTVEQKLEAIILNPVTNLLELSATPVKPLLDVLGQDTIFYGYVDGKWINGGDEVTVRMELTHLAKKIAELSADVQRRHEETATLNRKISKLETYLDDNWSDIDEEVRDELCEIFDIEGEVTKTIKITVSGTVEITAPRGYDWDNIGEDIDLDCSTIINNHDLTEAGYGFSHDETEVEEY